MPHLRHHPVVRLIAALSLAVVLATGLSATVAASTSSPTKLAGTWSGRYSGSYSGTFTLHWRQTGSALRGSIALSNPHGTYNLSGSVNGNTITFGAVGAGATYSGSVSRSGTSMSGRYKTGNGGGGWSAHKTS